MKSFRSLNRLFFSKSAKLLTYHTYRLPQTLGFSRRVEMNVTTERLLLVEIHVNKTIPGFSLADTSKKNRGGSYFIDHVLIGRKYKPVTTQ